MALSGLDIYKLLPKTNCKECGYATCLAFAMALAQKKTSLDACPHVSAKSREALESAAQPPIRLVTIGTGEKRIEIGNETVMCRHEQKFFHAPAVGFLVEDTLDDEDLAGTLKRIAALSFERAGQVLRVNLVCVKNVSGYRNKFLGAIKKTAALTDLTLALLGSDIEILTEALGMTRDRKPLLVCDEPAHSELFIRLAKEYGVPLALSCRSLEDAADLTAKAKAGGVDDVLVNLTEPSLAARVQDYTLMRRTALKKNVRALGYPILSFTTAVEADAELAEAVTYVAKFSGVVIVRNTAKEFVYPLLVARQDIYADPQKPVQVEPRIYEIGKVTADSPVLITTNFSITYFTVAGEVEGSKVPAYVICCDAEGMSVLTAWAADKFSAERISATLKDCGIAERVSHRRVIIPGYVSMLSGKLEEASGWKVLVGPREASGIVSYLRGLA